MEMQTGKNIHKGDKISNKRLNLSQKPTENDRLLKISKKLSCSFTKIAHYSTLRLAEV